MACYDGLYEILPGLLKSTDRPSRGLSNVESKVMLTGLEELSQACGWVF